MCNLTRLHDAVKTLDDKVHRYSTYLTIVFLNILFTILALDIYPIR